MPTVVSLVDQQATREEILEQAKNLAASVPEDGTLWFIFIGHGAPDLSGTDARLLGADVQQNPRSLEARGLKRSELFAVLEAGNQARTVAVLDTCFSGRGRAGEYLMPGTQPVLPVDAAQSENPKTIVFTAARADQVAGQLPDQNRPAFSYLVLGGLRGWADTGDGEVTASEVNSFVTQKLLTFPGRSQTPELWGSSNQALVKGARETFPSPKMVGVYSALQQTPEVVTKEPVHVEGTRQDRSYDFFVFAGLSLGIGSELKQETTTPWLAGKLGLKFVELGPVVVRGGVHAIWFTSQNPKYTAAKAAIDQASEQTQTPYWTFEDGQDYHRVNIMVGPGLSWRWQDGEAWWHDLVVGIDALGGFATSRQRCKTWDLTSEEYKVSCAENEDVPTEIALGLRATAHWRFMELGLSTDIIPSTDEAIMGVTVGFSFDP